MKKIIFSILLLTSLAIFGKDSSYVFGWSHLENPDLKIPRGGTTTGPKVNLDTKLALYGRKFRIQTYLS